MGNNLDKSAINKLFSEGIVFVSDDKILDEALKFLSTELQSPVLDAQTLSRVLIINTIKQQRHIDKIEKRNQIYTWLIIGLSIAAIIVQILPLILSCYGKK